MNVEVISHRIEVQNAAEEAVARALEAIGIQCESNAKANINGSIPRSGSRSGTTGRLINSITHQVVESEKSVYVGSNVEYAVYNEVGTGIYADGGGGRKDPWSYQDEKGEWHTTHGMKPIHFLKKAVEEHVDEYKKIAEQQLKG